MNLWRLVVVLFVGVALIGCQYKVPLMNTPMDVSGKLTKGLSLARRNWTWPCRKA